ncbi:hypothetical protein PILCRDRAFT_825130 [Piloderma croceum F 1598]|uniref:Uncharacterized protein n=1 Tax=Piloderma croceum (strain F 1598) TaxID=765440 RepID=A0A0C3BK33_PILCF|nr:hypothetical protein PILCRDRAFT_825130 [Piloderma croceum F 1598]
MVLFSRLALASHYGTTIDFLNPAALRCVRHASFIIMTNGLLTLITLRVNSLHGSKTLRVASLNVMLFRTEALTEASCHALCNALWPSFRPFCHTGARYTPEQKHGHLPRTET